MHKYKARNKPIMTVHNDEEPELQYQCYEDERNGVGSAHANSSSAGVPNFLFYHKKEQQIRLLLEEQESILDNEVTLSFPFCLPPPPPIFSSFFRPQTKNQTAKKKNKNAPPLFVRKNAMPPSTSMPMPQCHKENKTTSTRGTHNSTKKSVSFRLDLNKTRLFKRESNASSSSSTTQESSSSSSLEYLDEELMIARWRARQDVGNVDLPPNSMKRTRQSFSNLPDLLGCSK